VKGFWQSLPEKDDVWLYKPVTSFSYTMRDFHPTDDLLHSVIRILSLTIDASLCGKRAMRFHNLVSRYTRFSLQTVNVLCEELKQFSLLVKQTDERMCYGGTIFAGV
jgi:hypothetical protein